MLPTEAFAETVAFLRLFDLSALAVTNLHCSSVAVKASGSLRCEEFMDLHFYVAHYWVQAMKCVGIDEYGSFDMQNVELLGFPNEIGMAEFVADAFPNCVFGNMTAYLNKAVMDALGRVADSIMIKGALILDVSLSPDRSLSFVRKFRQVKALRLMKAVSDDEANEVAKAYRGSGVRELQYYRPGSTLMKISLV